MSDRVTPETARSNPAGFFHIDQRTWEWICDSGDINLPVSYLCVAAGTDRGNRFSNWSATAIEKYAGMHHSRGRAALAELIKQGYLRLDPASKRTRPRYELLTFDEVHATRLHAARAKDSRMDASWKDVLAGKTRRGTALHLALQETARKWVNDGLLWADGTRFSEVPPESGDALLWLPNTLVTGTLAGEYPPIAKLRRRGDIRPLQLLINLYGVHDLGADGGILRTALRRKYRAKKLGEYGTHAIWGFSGGNSELYWGAATAFLKNAKSDSGSHPIWGVLSVLEEMGLLTVVPHLVENSSLSCEILHGYGSARVGNKAEIGLPLEQRLGELAGEAAIRLLGPEAVSEAKREGFTTLAPVWCDLPDVQMVGIYRLTYRPHTQRTTEWLARATQRSPDWQEIYSAVPWRYESWGGRAHAG